MFELGQNYSFEMIGLGGEGREYIHGRVIEANHPLVKIDKGTGEQMIINTAALIFVSAQRHD